jgi:hypothetical protein
VVWLCEITDVQRQAWPGLRDIWYLRIFFSLLPSTMGGYQNGPTHLSTFRWRRLHNTECFIAHHVPVAVLLMIRPSRSEFKTDQLRYQEQESGHQFFMPKSKAYPFQTGGPGTFQFVLP